MCCRAKDSPIADFYPTDFAIDLNGKKHTWQAVILLPLIDVCRLLVVGTRCVRVCFRCHFLMRCSYDPLSGTRLSAVRLPFLLTQEPRLLSTIRKVEETFSEEEAKRNSWGSTYLFVHQHKATLLADLDLQPYGGSSVVPMGMWVRSQITDTTGCNTRNDVPYLLVNSSLILMQIMLLSRVLDSTSIDASSMSPTSPSTADCKILTETEREDIETKREEAKKNGDKVRKRSHVNSRSHFSQGFAL